MAESIYCEVCGETGAHHEDPYYPGEGHTVDMCATCIRLQRRQAEIDARWNDMLDTPLIPLPA